MKRLAKYLLILVTLPVSLLITLASLAHLIQLIFVVVFGILILIFSSLFGGGLQVAILLLQEAAVPLILTVVSVAVLIAAVCCTYLFYKKIILDKSLAWHTLAAYLAAAMVAMNIGLVIGEAGTVYMSSVTGNQDIKAIGEQWRILYSLILYVPLTYVYTYFRDKASSA